MERKHTIREEANALTCLAFRNGMIENLHAGKYSELLEDPKLSRITDKEMKQLMIEASAILAKLLKLKGDDPDQYWANVNWCTDAYTSNWVKDEPA